MSWPQRSRELFHRVKVLRALLYRAPTGNLWALYRRLTTSAPRLETSVPSAKYIPGRSSYSFSHYISAMHLCAEEISG